MKGSNEDLNPEMLRVNEFKMQFGQVIQGAQSEQMMEEDIVHTQEEY